jgi:hypothetical protein
MNKCASNASNKERIAPSAHRLLICRRNPRNGNWTMDTLIENALKNSRAKHPRENDSLFANLEKVMRLLRGGHKIGSFQIGFFRSEGEGVYRIGQTGVPSAKESRLYIYPDQENRLMHILNIGDKDTQPADINAAKDLVRQIRKELSKEGGENKHSEKSERS